MSILVERVPVRPAAIPVRQQGLRGFCAENAGKVQRPPTRTRVVAGRRRRCACVAPRGCRFAGRGWSRSPRELSDGHRIGLLSGGAAGTGSSSVPERTTRSPSLP